MNKKLLGTLALFSVTVLWGSSFVVLKNTLDYISVFWVLAIRFFIATIIFVVISNKKLINLCKKTICGGIIMGASMAIAYIFQTYGLFYTTPGKNAFLTATYCFFVPLLSCLFQKKKLTVNNIIATILCMTGIGFISVFDGFGVINIGDIFTLICGIFYSIQILAIEYYVVDSDLSVLSAIEFCTAFIICIICASLFDEFPTNIPVISVAAIFYMGIVCTAICFYLQSFGQKYTPSNIAALIMPLEAVFGTIFSIIYYNEKMTFNFVIGAILTTCAVIISEIKLAPKS